MSHELHLGKDTGAGAPFHLDPARLRTHGVVVGMTGSGKTGLSLVLLEELVGAGVPIIAIDPKGDLGNLGLVFPSLAPEEFAPWAAEEDPMALSLRWKAGLARWDIGVEDTARLAARMDLRIYTPGSEAGIPVDAIGSLRRPPPSVLLDAEARRELVSDLVGGLLGLVGQHSDPLRDPAHVVLSRIVDEAWTRGEDLDLEALVLRLVDPPFEKVGVFPLDRYFGPDERMKLAVALNTVLAAPGFAAWGQGVQLDVEGLLEVEDGRVPVHVFNLSHLDEAQRQFFVALLLGRVQAWSRAQPGTERLRALVFFDEVAGYLPPHPRQPPSKGPLLTLMKQARAVGLGVVLSTQNPVDLDYKALSNAGLWAIGRLSTPQDRERLLKGLGNRELDAQVAALKKRHFLVVQTGRAEPAVVQSRHAMCYLRGPFTRRDVSRFVGARPSPVQASWSTAASGASAHSTTASAPATPEVDDGLLPVAPAVAAPSRYLDPRVVFSARLAPHFDAAAEPQRPDGATVWRPALVARLQLRFDEDRHGFVIDEELARLWFPVGDDGPGEPSSLRLDDRDLLGDPTPGSRFAPLPSWLDEDREWKGLTRSVVEDVYRTETRGMFVNAALKAYGKPGEARDAFDARCRAQVEDRIDAAAATLQERYEKKVVRLQDRINAKEAKLVEKQGVLQSRRVAEAVNVGETLLSFFGGRRRSLGSAVTKRRQSATAKRQLATLGQEIERLGEQIQDLELELQEKLDDLRAAQEDKLDVTVEREVRLEKADIRLLDLSLLWVPVTRRI
jgi:hypothetical protein